ncbi:MAG: T9SS type A sorting domain-containing protein [FCB group bacterium]|nr:T9SS type A sorting domain-containing protein [FCB group bacterium]
MGFSRLLLTALALLFCFSSLSQSQPVNKRIIGYFTSWSVYGRDYHVPDIPAEMITHINYAFANIDGNTSTIMLGDAYADIDKFYPGDSWDPDSLRGSFHQLQILRGNHPHLKNFISVGGWTWSTYFSNVALTEQSRHNFAYSCMEFITEYTFDGIDIDWEYPVSGGLSTNITRPEDRENFTLLLAEIREQLDSLEVVNGQEYLLTIAAPANPAIIANIEVELIHQYLDWINIMTFDYHGPWMGDPDQVTNFNTPLHIVPEDPTPEPYYSTFNLEAGVNAYLALGVPADKIQPGLAFYGRGYASVANTNNGLFADYNGPAWQGTWEGGVFDYWDIAANYEDVNGYTSYWNDDAKVPWVFNPNTAVMISYDNPQSITEKGQYILEQDLAGAMFWEFSGDKYHVLLETIFETLEGGYAPPDVNLELSPYGTIVIPPNGGDFDFNIQVSNNTAVPQTFDLWTTVTLPNSTEIEVMNIQDFTLPGNMTIDRDRSQVVPSGAPGGEYIYTGYAGSQATGEIISTDSFTFLKAGDGAEADYHHGWENWGESFNEELSIAQNPDDFTLFDAYPNPFNAETVLNYQLNWPGEITLAIINIDGRLVTRLAHGFYPAGSYQVRWNAEGLSSGVYFAVLESGGMKQIQKMILLK